MCDRLRAIIAEKIVPRNASPASDSESGDGPDYVATRGLRLAIGPRRRRGRSAFQHRELLKGAARVAAESSLKWRGKFLPHPCSAAREILSSAIAAATEQIPARVCN